MTTPATRPTGEWASYSPEETRKLGVHFGNFLRGGEIVLLSGPLGAGTTLFVKGIAEALKIPGDDVTSPSFTLVNQYTGRLTLYHIDLYRLNEGAGAAHAVDLDELLMDESAVIVIEWAERMGAYPLPEPVWRIHITGDGDAPRTIDFHNEPASA
jgi:tRNA threonylcarbamoyladenosine biosynthesis protein TsaE